jgi:hypothetical protein
MWFAVVALPADAAPVRLFPTRASASGSATYEFVTTATCGFVVASEDGTFAGIGTHTTPPQRGTYHLDICVEPAAGFFAQSGTFTISTRVGTLTGTLTGTESGLGGPYTQTLTITGASRAYSHANGTIQIAGMKTFGTSLTWTATATWTASISR